MNTHRTLVLAGTAAVLLSVGFGLHHRSASPGETTASGSFTPTTTASGLTTTPKARRVTQAASAHNPRVASPELTALAEQIEALRAIPIHQYRSWTNRLAIEDALLQMKELGVRSAAELPHGVLEDPLSFLDEARRAEVEPLIADTNQRLQDLRFDTLGRALEADEVDKITSLEAEREATLEKVLTPEEMALWAAHNTWEGQLLRELPVELEPDQFAAAALVEHQFQAKAAQLNLDDPSGIENLTRLGAWREKALGQILGADTGAALEKASRPGYTGMVEAATSQGLDSAAADFLWNLNHWQDATAFELAEGNWDQITALQEDVREKARQQLIATFGEATAQAWMQSEAGSVLAPTTPTQREPSISTPYPLSDGLDAGQPASQTPGPG